MPSWLFPTAAVVLAELNIPTLGDINTSVMDQCNGTSKRRCLPTRISLYERLLHGRYNQVLNSVMPQVNSTLQTFNNAYLNELKTALSVR
jgi:hypothetical protein